MLVSDDLGTFSVQLVYFSSFADEHLENMDKRQLSEFDRILNDSDSDWQLYYWITGQSVGHKI